MRRRVNHTEDTEAVLRHLCVNGRQNLKQIEHALPAVARGHVQRLVMQGHIVELKECQPAEFCVSSSGRRKVAEIEAASTRRQKRHRETMRRGLYAGTELMRNQGIPAERFAAFSLPSRIGKRLHWPDGRITNLDHSPIK